MPCRARRQLLALEQHDVGPAELRLRRRQRGDPDAVPVPRRPGCRRGRRVRTDLHRRGGAAAHRGRLVGLVQFNIVLGILLAYRIQRGRPRTRRRGPRMALDARCDGGARGRLPAAAAHRARDAAVAGDRRSVGRGREAIGPPLCTTQEESEFQMGEIRESLAAAENAPSVPFFTPGHRKVIMLAIAIAFFNQMSGINAILYYAPRVMQEAGRQHQRRATG